MSPKYVRVTYKTTEQLRKSQPSLVLLPSHINSTDNELLLQQLRYKRQACLI